jgi:outer membrane lipoprotein-sorting protein
MLMRNNRLLYIIVFIAAGSFLLFSKSSNASTENDFEKLHQTSVKIKTLQGDFIQKKSMKILAKPLVSEGRFYFIVPDSFRWEYFKPLKSIVVAHKNTTRRYIYADGKMVEDKTGGAQAMKIVLSEVASWMNGRFDQNPSFKANISKSGSTKITLTPVEKSMADFIQKIEITLSPKEGVVKSVKIYEGVDNFTQINFNNVKINEAISPTIFQDVQ